MDKMKNRVLDDFIDSDDKIKERKKNKIDDEAILEEREGLIERVNKIILTKDGKQLLME